MELNDNELKRWLRVANWKTKNLAQNIEKTVVWREQSQINKMRVKDVKELAYKGMSYVHGITKERHPILYYRPAKIHAFDGMEKLLVLNVEHAISVMPYDVENFAVIADMEGLKYRNIPPLRTIKKTVEVLNNYPGRISHVFVLNWNGPSLFAWRCLRPFLSKKIKDKFLFLSSKEKRSILRYISKEQLEAAVGGQNTAVFDPALMLPQW